MAGETLAQGFQLFLVDRLTAPSTPVLREVGNITNLGEFGGVADDLDTTNLMSTAKEKIRGLIDNGEMSLQVNLNTVDQVHKLLWKLHKMTPAQGDPRTQWIIAGSDGVALPTLDSNDSINPPGDRAWWSFDASVKSFRFPVSVNTIVNSTVALSISGAASSSMDT